MKDKVIEALESFAKEETEAHKDIHNQLQELIELVKVMNKRNTKKENV